MLGTIKVGIKHLVAKYLFDRGLQNDTLFRMITGTFINPPKTRREIICGHSVLINIPSLTVFHNLHEDLKGKNEQATIKYLAENLRDGDVFCDVGANIGIYPVLAGKLARLDANIAIEPSSQNYAELVRNTMLNDLQNTVCLHYALSDHTAVVDFPAGDLSPGYMHGQVGKGGGFVEKVQLAVFDELVDQIELKLPSVILMDIDGAEVEAFNGMAKTLSNEFLRIVIVEVDPSTVEDVEQILTNKGFKTTQDRTQSRGNEMYERS